MPRMRWQALAASHCSEAQDIPIIASDDADAAWSVALLATLKVLLYDHRAAAPALSMRAELARRLGWHREQVDSA